MMEQQILSKMSEFEEGEISNESSDNLYTPLERPYIPAAFNCNQLGHSESDDDNDARDSSSDSDSSGKKKIPKMRKLNKHNQIKTDSNKKKNFNIWNTDIQADILTNSLIGCNMDQSSRRGRDVESYNYRLKVFVNQDDKVMSNVSNNEEKKNVRYSTKRKHDGAYKDNKLQPKNRIAVSESQPSMGNPRNILNLCTTIENSESEVAVDIANKLFEEKEDLILRAVNVLGKEKVITFFEETRKIEENGGMLIMNGTRRRTPGGVFFYLIKSSDELSQDKISQVFLDDKKSLIKNKRQEVKERKKKKKNPQLKEALSKDDFPTLLSRTKLAIEKFKDKRLAQESSEVLNPPPSPAADGRISGGNGEDLKEQSEAKRNLVKYEDDLFECKEATMESD